MSKPVMLTLAPLLVLLAGAFVLTSCAGLSRDEVERRLAELPQGKALRDLGLREFTAAGVDGRAWFAARSADAPADAPMFVLVHGTPATPQTWMPFVDGSANLRAAGDVVLLEIPGHGAARAELEPGTFAQAGAFVAGALAALDLRDVVLVGHSYGGEFALHAALEAQDRLRGLVLIDSAGLPREREEFLPEEIAMREHPLAKFGIWLHDEERVQGALVPHFANAPRDEFATEAFLACARSSTWDAMVELARDENGTRASELPRVHIPVLLLWGERDLAYPPSKFASRFAADLPDAKLVVLDGVGHYPIEEARDRVAAELVAFARSAPPRR
jgi:pimeloyl-ACP methyl ester carboxylesterase